MADLLFDYNIKKTAQIFDEDDALRSTLINYGLYLFDFTLEEKNPDRIGMFEDLASILLADHDFISERSIEDLWSLRYLVDRMNQIFNKFNVVDEVIYRQIIFSYKYSTIKNFFRDNFTKFLPSLDASVISDSSKMSLFQAAFMQEYDRFADIIDDIYNITDIDKVGNDYLSYLVQILGYEKSDDKLLGKDSFRELAKNIIEVYKIKGTNYSFELFFNFLGFDVELNEFYFDRRYADEGITINPYTGSDNPQDFSYYLTPKRPTTYTPDNMKNPYQILDNQLTDIRSHLWWERKIFEGQSVEKLLGLDPKDPPEEGFDYTFFKTNIIQYSVRRIRSKETDADELSAEDEEIIQAYADFLTPIFISKQIQISIQPFEDVAESLIFKDNTFFNVGRLIWENTFKSKQELFISDYWINKDLSNEEAGDLAALLPLEQVDVGLGGTDEVIGDLEKEEPIEFYLFIKTYNHNSTDNNFTKDDMTNLYDYDTNVDNEWIPGPNFFKVNIENKTKTEYGDTDSLISLYDLAYQEGVFQRQELWNLAPLDEDSPYSILKVLDFQEAMFNRVHRTEELNVMSRDWLDWDNFQQVRVIPNFEDSFDMDKPLEDFYKVENPGSENIYYSSDDDISHTPWWFYDEILMKATTYNFIGFGFATTSVITFPQIQYERGVLPSLIKIEDSNDSLSFVDFRAIHLGKIIVRDSAEPKSNYEIEREAIPSVLGTSGDSLVEVETLEV